MKIIELKDRQGNVNIDVKIIWDLAKPEDKFGKRIKSVLVVDADAVQGDGSPSAYLDMYNEDIELYQKGDKIQVLNAFSKLIPNKTQFRLTNAKQIRRLEDGDDGAQTIQVD